MHFIQYKYTTRFHPTPSREHDAMGELTPVRPLILTTIINDWVQRGKVTVGLNLGTNRTGLCLGTKNQGTASVQ